MPPGDRAIMADIVAYGVVRRTFRNVDDLPTSSASRQPLAADDEAPNTYMAEVRLQRVVKGRALVDEIHIRNERFAAIDQHLDEQSEGIRQFHCLISFIV